MGYTRWRPGGWTRESVRCCEGPEAEPWSTTRTTAESAAALRPLLELQDRDVDQVRTDREGASVPGVFRPADPPLTHHEARPVTKRTRRRLKRVGASASLAPPATPVGIVTAVSRVTFGTACLEVLTTPWLLERCTSDRGWRWVASPDVLDLGELASVPLAAALHGVGTT